MGTRSAASSVSPRRFEIRACLGRGGFGEVYLALMSREGGVQAEVAVKVLATGLDPEGVAVDRLRDEGLLLGLLNHPVVPKVIDLIVLQGRVAMVTEYVEGEDLDTCIKSDGVPTRALLEVVGGVAEALHAAWHTKGPTGRPMKLVHRDIKPSNIRIGRHGQVKLLDFGVARAWDVDRIARTQGMALLGSWSYMAPERIDDPDGTAIHPAADVYGLGCVMYEGIAGIRLTGGLRPRDLVELRDTPDGYEHLVGRQLSTIRAVCDREVWMLLERMLAIDPKRRPSPDEVVHRCEKIAESLPGESLRQWARERAWPTPSRTDGPLVGRVLSEAMPQSAIEEEPSDDEERTELFTLAHIDDSMVTAGATEDSVSLFTAEFDEELAAALPGFDDFDPDDEVTDVPVAPLADQETTDPPAALSELVDPELANLWLSQDQAANLSGPSDEETVNLLAPPDEETVNLLVPLEEETAILPAEALAGFDPSSEGRPERSGWWTALWLLVGLPGIALVLLVMLIITGAGVVVYLSQSTLTVGAPVEDTPIAAPATAPEPSSAQVPVSPAPATPSSTNPGTPDPDPAVAPTQDPDSPEPAELPPVPVPVVAPAPVPAPAPSKVIVVRPVPVAPVTPASGTAEPGVPAAPAIPGMLVVQGTVLVELRTTSGAAYRSGAQLPPARYQVWANFGRMFIDTGLRPLVESGALVTVSCDPITARCTTDR